MKEQTDKKCPHCGKMLMKEYWGSRNSYVDWVYSCSCGYWIMVTEKKDK